VGDLDGAVGVRDARVAARGAREEPVRVPLAQGLEEAAGEVGEGLEGVDEEEYRVDAVLEAQAEVCLVHLVTERKPTSVNQSTKAMKSVGGLGKGKLPCRLPVSSGLDCRLGIWQKMTD